MSDNLEESKAAIVLSPDFIAQHKLDVGSLPHAGGQQSADVQPEAPSFSRVRRSKGRHFDHQPVVPQKSNEQITPIAASSGEASELPEPIEPRLDASRLRGFDEMSERAVEPLAKRSVDSLVRMPRESTNVGVSADSKQYIRGVLHNDAPRTYRGAWGYVLTIGLVVAAFFPMIYVVLDKQQYLWGLLTPVLLICALFVYLGIARNCVCPVCRQRQFSPKACKKHVRAHHVRGLGVRLSTAIHLVRYKWFRCAFCGTSIRVKE